MSHAFLTDPGKQLLAKIRSPVRAGEERVLEEIGEWRFKQDMDRVLESVEAILAQAESLASKAG